MRITIPYGSGTVGFDIPAGSPTAVLAPRPATPAADARAEIRRALDAPIAAGPLAAAVAGARSVVILADDLTRQTPSHLIIPALLDELNASGLRDEQCSVLIALGTHRPMTEAEIRAHYGPEVATRVRVVNSPWQDPGQMVDLGVTPNGTPISIARAALAADFLIGLGSIVPHHIPGFSAGAKIVQPGISGAETTGATHLFSVRSRRSYLGLVDNPVRAEMELIAERAGLRAIFNVVLDTKGRLVRAFYGDPRAAHRAGVAVAAEVYGVPLPGQADIVIAGSHPCDIEFWQAHKSLYPADLAVRTGGTVIVVTPAPEGVSVSHREMLNFTALPAERIDAAIADGTLTNVVSAALALAWAKMRERANILLVSDGISADEARALGFTPHPSVQDALAAALRVHGAGASINVLPYAPETLPLA
ncbi:MAG: hypothetical protein BWY52_00514 [Chloroflexi bacterium ADurb.Bin325]|nr:MAG: hypothetical protein BWY52_00514 [Chloroflexi bacterium ADurb.Bin325]